MKDIFETDPSLIYETRQGIERECLRVLSSGKVSLKPHPQNLGSKLTHAFITTDYSENLLEFITTPHPSIEKAYKELEVIHGYTQQEIGEELLWPSSMPAILPEEQRIPLAYYGESNVGKLKTLYRKGLGYRYGRSMQSIAGLHFNFSLSERFWEYSIKAQKSQLSLSDTKNEKYFHLIRNFQRYRWLLLYLFGASPAVDESFLEGKDHSLERLGPSTFFTPYGTSLRMGGLGYTSSAQENIGICYNQLPTYIQTLEAARLQPYPPYEKIGVKDGEWFKQLNTNLLQIDNEFYSTIRPKNIAKTRESALKALHLRGIEYIEVRLLDIDPFSPLGIDKKTIGFLHLFLLWCLSKESPKINATECDELDDNFEKIVLAGRDPKLKLSQDGNSIDAKELIKKIMDEITLFSEKFNQVEPFYTECLNTQWEKIENSDLLPSQRLIQEMKEKSFIDFSLDLAKANKAQYQISASDTDRFKNYGVESWAEQKRIEASDKLEFDDFLTHYFEQIKIEESHS